MSEENKAFIARYLDAVSGRDKPAELVGQFVSDETLLEHVALFEAAFPQYHLTPEIMVAEGSDVAVRATFRGIHGGDLMGLAPTGREVTLPVMLIYRMEGGKIVQHWMSVDRMDLMQQLGVSAG